MKKVVWQGDSLKTLQGFPDPVKYDFGVELMRVQSGLDPIDWKPMRSVGPGGRRRAKSTKRERGFEMFSKAARSRFG